MSRPPMSAVLALALLPVLAAGPAAAGGSPFVEAVQILQQSDGESPGDGYGFIVRSLGDLDGDLVPDYGVGLPTYSVGATNRGKVWVFSGATGDTIRTHVKAAGAYFGYEMAGVGDVTGDGRAEYVVCAPRTTTFTAISGTGKAFLFSGADGTQLHAWRGEDYGAVPASGFACQVAGAGHAMEGGVGDVDGDGTPDILLTSLLHGSPGPFVGRTFVFSGAAYDSVLLSVDGEIGAGLFGFGVGGVGDLDSDGHADFIVGAPASGPGGRGRAYVFRGIDGTQFPWSPLEPDTTGSFYGFLFAKGTGDVNGDAVPDLWVSDLSDSENGSRAGKGYLYSGADGTLIRRHLGEGPGAGFGVGRGCGDVDGDGRGDLFVASFTDSSVAPAAGKAYVISGGTGAILRTISNTAAGDQFGFSAMGAGDVNGDGAPDFLISAIFHDGAGEDAGRAYLIAGEPVASAAPDVPRAPFPMTVHPNPASGDVQIRLSLPVRGPLRVRVVDVAGRQVGELENGVREAGPAVLHWSGRGPDGRRAAPGRYWLVADAGARRAVASVTLVR